MKTAEQIAEEWADKVGATCTYHDQNLIQALREYGELVRQRAVAECQAEATCEGIAQKCAAAIGRMELP